MVSPKPVTIPVNLEVHECECCQGAAFARCDQPESPDCDCDGCRLVKEGDAAREHARLLALGMAELARELGRVKRENRRLEAAKGQLGEELKAAYGKIRKLTEERAWERLAEPFEPGPAAALLWDSVRRECEAKRAAKEVA